MPSQMSPRRTTGGAPPSGQQPRPSAGAGGRRGGADVRSFIGRCSPDGDALEPTQEHRVGADGDEDDEAVERLEPELRQPRMMSAFAMKPEEYGAERGADHRAGPAEDVDAADDDGRDDWRTTPVAAVALIVPN